MIYINVIEHLSFLHLQINLIKGTVHLYDQICPVSNTNLTV